MNNLHICTSKKLKDAEPTRVHRSGFLKLRKMYEYNFTSPSDYWRVLGKNRDVTAGNNKTITGGIIKGGAV